MVIQGWEEGSKVIKRNPKSGSKFPVVRLPIRSKEKINSAMGVWSGSIVSQQPAASNINQLLFRPFFALLFGIINFPGSQRELLKLFSYSPFFFLLYALRRRSWLVPLVYPFFGPLKFFVVVHIYRNNDGWLVRTGNRVDEFECSSI